MPQPGCPYIVPPLRFDTRRQGRQKLFPIRSLNQGAERAAPALETTPSADPGGRRAAAQRGKVHVPVQSGQSDTFAEQKIIP